MNLKTYLKENISSLFGTASNIQDDIEELQHSSLPVVVFGTGNGSGRMKKWLTAHSIRIDAFCESAAYWHAGKFVCGKPVFNYEELSVQCGKCNLIFAASGEGARRIWKNPGDAVNKIYFFNCFTPVYGNIEMTFDWAKSHADELNETYHMLSDEKSKRIFLSYIDERAHCLKNRVPHIFEQFTPNIYFNELYDLSKREHHTLIDCGAYDGDSAEQFLQLVRTRDKTGSVFAFEPDKANFDRLKNRVNRIKELGEVTCFQSAVGDKNEMISFAIGYGIESHCVEGSARDDNVVKMQVVRLDDELKNSEISAIKMDIEGSEMSALMGAQAIISEQLPFLAICVYHRDDDLIRIPPYINRLACQAGKKYDLYLRHHEDCQLVGTVLYAVPHID